jgi:pyruvate,water dikinase
MFPFAGLKNALDAWRARKHQVPFTVLFKKFKSILERNNLVLELMADMGDKLGGEYVFDRQYILDSCDRLLDQVFKLVSDLAVLRQRKHVDLFLAAERIQHQIREELAGRRALARTDPVLPLDGLTNDLGDECGNKMANLGDIRNTLGMATPEGFVITTGAYLAAVGKGALRQRIAKAVAGLTPGDEAALAEVSEKLRQEIAGLSFPRAMSRAVSAAAKELAGRTGALLAVRSSAWDEDTLSSFAGMYETRLGVRPEGLLDAYREVLASLFSEDALRYRLYRGLAHEEPAMAVGVVALVDAVVSGALYTYAPLADYDQAMVVSAAWGLGKPVVDGTAETDTYILHRDPPHQILSRDICPKSQRMVTAPEGGVRMDDLPEAERNAPCLTPEQLTELAEAALTLERFFRRPLDVEWAFDAAGTLILLQARPLRITPRDPQACPDPSLVAKDATVLFSGQGASAMGGVAAGPVYLARPGASLDDFPYGAILVASHSSPRYSKVMPKCRGIITDVGSATGHMATIARELRVPTLVGVEGAAKTLAPGQEITLDADRKVVYAGTVAALCRYDLAKEDVFEESREYRLLKRVLKRITPLTLVDPNAASFTPAACATCHDIARYVHQKAVEELINLSETHLERHEGAPRRLATALPLGVTLIDVDGGLDMAAQGEEVSETDLRCVPLLALLEGMTRSGMWETDPAKVDLKSFMSSVTRTFGADQSHPERMGRNLAVVSREYLNLHLRLGYHFTVVDAYIGERMNDNAVFFRFMGGVTELVRRSRRAELIGAILERFDFRVEIRGDMVTGRAKKHPSDRMLAKLRMLGGLIGYTRQLDARLDDEAAVAHHLEEFLQHFAPPKETAS